MALHTQAQTIISKCPFVAAACDAGAADEGARTRNLICGNSIANNSSEQQKQNTAIWPPGIQGLTKQTPLKGFHLATVQF